jgi:crotonobetainyl-CoA:carnitine CoA-transferase CaiB-like acyl-CoA transferase
MIAKMEHPEEGSVRQAGISIKLSRTPGSIRKFAPARGEDTVAILTDLGYDERDIAGFEKEGII